MNKKKIAVIGSGISGLSASFFLSKNFEVTLFEKNKYLGGHTRTIKVADDQNNYNKQNNNTQILTNQTIINKNKLIVDGSHNALGGKVLSEYLEGIESKKHLIVGMMSNKNHQEFLDNFINKISSLTTVDIPNQPNAITGKELKNKIKGFKNINYKNSIKEALVSLDLKENDIAIITGSLYLIGKIRKKYL